MTKRQLTMVAAISVPAILLIAVSARYVKSRREVPSWLHPSDAAYEFTLDQGFNYGFLEKKPWASEAGEPEELALNDDPDRITILIVPPLHCAFWGAASAAEKHEPKPTIGDTRKECDGYVGVSISSVSQSPTAKYAIKLDEPGHPIDPLYARHDGTPRFDSFGSPGYSYDEFFVLKPTHAWDRKLALEWTDGHVGSEMEADFTLLERDERSRE